jgi:two-component system CheB/CheR fusion protein
MRRVLIIEDNVDAADSLREALELAEHEVVVAYDGPGGIEKAREFGPDVVLCDIGLPRMDGYEVARAFRGEEALRPIYLVALTGHALTEDVAKAKEAGFDRHLPKPFSLKSLEQALAGPDSTASGTAGA